MANQKTSGNTPGPEENAPTDHARDQSLHRHQLHRQQEDFKAVFNDSRANPRNWPWKKKTYHGLVPSLFCLTITFGSSVYTPGISSIQQEFNVSMTVAVLGLSLYVLGLACGPMLAAPMSEIIGRRPVYFLCIIVFGLFTLGAGFSKSFVSLVICRFFAGTFGSPSLSVGIATIADMYEPSQRGNVAVWFSLAPFLGPALGPLVGGFAAEKKGWRWTQWTLLFLTAASLLSALGMQETYAKVLQQQRAKHHGGHSESESQPKSRVAAIMKTVLTTTLLRPSRMLFVEPIVLLFSLYIGCNFAIIFAFFDAFPIVYTEIYGFDTGQVGLTFLGIGLGCCLAALTFILIDRLTMKKRFEAAAAAAEKGSGREAVSPEHRLTAAMVGSIGLPLGLFWFAWTARSDVHWISSILATVPFAWGNFMIYRSATLYLSDVYGARYSASAMAANALLRYLFSAAFPLFTTQMYHGLGIGWATSVFGFLSLALMPVPWVLFQWGPRVRRHSRYAPIQTGA